MSAPLIASDGPSVLLATQRATVLAAESSEVLLRSFAIVLVVMAPIALWQGRRVRNRRQRQRSASYQQASDLAPLSARSAGTGSGPTLESVVAEINRVASMLGSSQTTELSVPAELTVGGSRADPQLVEAVLRDVLDRSGLQVIDTDSSGEVVQLVCRRR